MTRRISLTILLPILALITVYDVADARCSHTVYIMPLYADTTVLPEFENLENYFNQCQTKALKEDSRTVVSVLSLRKSSRIFKCVVGDDCAFKFKQSSFNDTKILHDHFMLALNTTYNMADFISVQTADNKCLANSVLIIPTNLRCIQAQQYPDFWNLIGNLDSPINNHIIKYKLSTQILWINYNYLSPTDNVGCELDYLLKKAGSPLMISTSDKDGKFLTEEIQVKMCANMAEPRGPALTKPIIIAIVVICTLVFLLCLSCIVLCVLKVKYRYKILKMDFLFRRQNKQNEELPASNYYTMGSADGDKWELSMEELDIDYDNVLGSGAFAYVVQATLLGQRVSGASRGVSMFNGNLVAVKILHSTADELARINFIREIELMKSFDHHAHMLNLVGCISNPENSMLVSELCEIGDLRQILVAHKPHDIFEDRPQCEQSGVTCLRGKDLTSFAWQVSDALCYLSSHQFVHKDIAARNVFVNRALVAKLGDFGLCHSLDPLSALHAAPQTKVPMKWSALEAIQSGMFSEKSDVWSYGVLLFEMYTGASMPYPTIESDDLLEALISGVRPEISDDAPENMRLLMNSCWLEDPEERPNFEEIRTRLSGLLDVCSQAYGYIQFAQHTQDDVSVPTTPISKQIPALTFQKEIEYANDSDSVKELEELEEVH